MAPQKKNSESLEIRETPNSLHIESKELKQELTVSRASVISSNFIIIQSSYSDKEESQVILIREDIMDRILDWYQRNKEEK